MSDCSFLQTTIVQGREIGEGGVLIVSNEFLEKGCHVVLNFFMAKNRFVTVTGEIVYKIENKQELFGIKFINLSFEGKRAIREFIADKSLMEVHEEKAI